MERQFDEFLISKAILDSYYRKFNDALLSDVTIVGAGPSGLFLAGLLARKGFRVVVIEAKLAPGGGIWGGGMGMNEVVFQPEILPLLDIIDVSRKTAGSLYTADACELAAQLTVFALKSGATIMNLITAEDLVVLGDRVTGVVANRTGISGRYHVDPIMFTSKAVVDATGHDAVLVNFLNKHGYKIDTSTGSYLGEGAMDVVAGERFVVERAGEVFPGLYVMGMAVSATFNGPRMGPIFGGMLLSAQKVSNILESSLR
ncbi:MAG: sulfide-dependent adenosine diphosphate thiazole synthase [Planctomycetota bacterium]